MSNYRLIIIIRFILYESVILYLVFLTTYNSPCMCPNIRCAYKHFWELNRPNGGIVETLFNWMSEHWWPYVVTHLFMFHFHTSHTIFFFARKTFQVISFVCTWVLTVVKYCDIIYKFLYFVTPMQVQLLFTRSGWNFHLVQFAKL